MENNNNITRNTPKDVFFHLLNILTFFVSIVGLIMLYINYVNMLFPDALTFYYRGIADSVRLAMAMLFVAIPVYILTSWFLEKEIVIEPQKRELKLRKGLIYFTLFIAAVTIIVDLITFIYRFLDGELSIRFFLKVLVVLLITGSVFGYYIWELKRKNIASKVPKILAYLLSLIVLVSIAAGFFIVGTPGEQRERRFDDDRINNLQQIQSEIINYWSQKEILPANLGELEDSISGFIIPNDPDPREETSYEYIISDSLSFQLCATFKTSSKDFEYNNNSRYYPFSIDQNWEHEAERTCFERTIDPDLYKNKF
jgi:hypothetical protein